MHGTLKPIVGFAASASRALGLSSVPVYALGCGGMGALGRWRGLTTLWSVCRAIAARRCTCSPVARVLLVPSLLSSPTS
eukprot:7555662-Pyramimonas_sp.AAC.1